MLMTTCWLMPAVVMWHHAAFTGYFDIYGCVTCHVDAAAYFDVDVLVMQAILDKMKWGQEKAWLLHFVDSSHSNNLELRKLPAMVTNIKVALLLYLCVSLRYLTHCICVSIYFPSSSHSAAWIKFLILS